MDMLMGMVVRVVMDMGMVMNKMMGMMMDIECWINGDGGNDNKMALFCNELMMLLFFQ